MGLYERTTAQRGKRRRRRRLRPILLILLLVIVAAAVILLTKSCGAELPPVSKESKPVAEEVPPTTEPPATEAPTTVPPTTEAPTTVPPTTEAPTEETTEATTEATEPPTEEPTEEVTEPTEAPTEEITEPTTEATTAPTEPDVEASQKIVDVAKAQVGKPYAYGGVGPDAYDTSGLVYYCCKKAGISLPRTTDRQAKKGTQVEKEDLQPGDVVFFWTSTPGAVEYQGVYIGDGKFIAARNPEKPVSELELEWDYFKERYLFARRYW